MANKGTSLRLDPKTLTHADRLARRLKRIPEFSATGEVTRSTVLRYAIALGLEEIDRRYGPQGHTGRRRR